MMRALLTSVGVAACVVGAAGCATQHQHVDGEPANSPNQVLNNFHVAASRADFDAYFAAWTEQSVFLGTDATERWEGRQFKDFAKPYFEKGQGWTYLPRERHVTIEGSTAWFDELLDNEKYGECRGSGVLLQRRGTWVIVQYNLSFPIPNDMAAEVTGKIKGGKKK